MTYDQNIASYVLCLALNVLSTKNSDLNLIFRFYESFIKYLLGRI